MKKRNRKMIKYRVLAVVWVLLLGWMMIDYKNVEANMLDPYIFSTSIPTAPEPTPALPPSIIEIIRFNFQDKGERVVQEAIKVFSCESGLKPTALNDRNKNGSKDAGIAQINSIHGVPQRFLKNPKINIAVARQLYDESGGSWRHWYSSASCHHLK